MNNYLPRAYHSAIYYPNDGLMYIYAGCYQWSQTDGYTYSPLISTYDWSTDTWINKSNGHERVRCRLVYDPLSIRIIAFGGHNDSTYNDTRFYYPEIDSWERTIDGMRGRDYGTAVWDDYHNRLLYYGGRRGNDIFNSLWFYSPYTPAYAANGSILSSYYDAGTQVRLRTLSFEASNIIPELGSEPVQIQLSTGQSGSGSGGNPAPEQFIGPDGTSNTFFTKSTGEAIPVGYDDMRIIRYSLNLSTEDLLYSPEFRSIRIDYFTYKSSETFDSIIYQPKYAIHQVDWNATLPTGTDVKFYMRYGTDATKILSAAWMELTNGQQNFDGEPMDYFQYRAVLSTSDPIETPVVHGLTFALNRPPAAPTALFPSNGSHYSTAKPELTWSFSDPDGLDTDAQAAYELQVSFRKEFDFMNFESGVVSTNISTCLVDTELSDGWYYWRVRTEDNYQAWGPYSAVYRIYIDTKPPAPPVVKSYTHTVNATWYSQDTAIFDWDAPGDSSGITGYSYSMNQSRSGFPPEKIMLSSNEFSLKKNSEVFSGLVQFNDLADGVWYFRVSAVDGMGHWSTPFTFLLRIDCTPVVVEDFSDEQATTGEDLAFEFELEDIHSGPATAELAWRYEGELEYQKEFINIIDEDTIYFDYTMQDVDSDFVEYYLTVTDNAVPPNIYRFPGGKTKQIPLSDNDPPTVINSSESFSQDISKEMVIHIRAKDNIDVTSAGLYLAGEVEPRTMRETASGYFEYRMDKTQLKSLFADGGIKEETYFIIINDGANNSVRAPSAGTYTITLKVTSDDDTNGGKKVETDDVSGVSYGAVAAIVAVLIVVFIIIIFLIMRRHKMQVEQVEEEQSKLRMQLLGTSTDGPAAVPSPAPGELVMPPPELAGMAGISAAQTPMLPAGAEADTYGGEEIGLPSPAEEPITENTEQYEQESETEEESE